MGNIILEIKEMIENMEYREENSLIDTGYTKGYKDSLKELLEKLRYNHSVLCNCKSKMRFEGNKKSVSSDYLVFKCPNCGESVLIGKIYGDFKECYYGADNEHIKSVSLSGVVYVTIEEEVKDLLYL